MTIFGIAIPSDWGMILWIGGVLLEIIGSTIIAHIVTKGVERSRAREIGAVLASAVVTGAYAAGSFLYITATNEYPAAQTIAAIIGLVIVLFIDYAVSNSIKQ